MSNVYDGAARVQDKLGRDLIWVNVAGRHADDRRAVDRRVCAERRGTPTAPHSDGQVDVAASMDRRITQRRTSSRRGLIDRRSALQVTALL